MFLFLFQKETSKILRTLPVIDHDVVILANVNINHSDSRSVASSPNDSMEESQCVFGKYKYRRKFLKWTGLKNSKINISWYIKMIFFVSENVVKLSNRRLSKVEVYLLSKGLICCPTLYSVDKSVIKEDLEKFGRILRLMAL